MTPGCWRWWCDGACWKSDSASKSRESSPTAAWSDSGVAILNCSSLPILILVKYTRRTIAADFAEKVYIFRW